MEHSWRVGWLGWSNSFRYEGACPLRADTDEELILMKQTLLHLYKSLCQSSDFTMSELFDVRWLSACELHEVLLFTLYANIGGH